MNEIPERTALEEKPHFDGPVISIRVKYLVYFAYGYLLLPILLFFLTWLRWYVGVPAACILLAGTYFLLKREYTVLDETMELPCVTLFISCILIAVWVVYTGLGGMFFQTADNHARNAIFRDMVNFSWPVIYPETGNALVYYLMFWIVPAALGKIGGWAVANVSLAFWGMSGILLAYFFVLLIAKPRKKWHVLLAAGMVIFWSGENLMGMVVSTLFQIVNTPFSFGSWEGWLDFWRNGFDCSYLYRSNLDAVCQVYNQSIVPWLASAMAIHNPKTRIFAFLGLCALPYGPLPFIGLLPVFLVLFLQENWSQLKRFDWKKVLKRVFSIPNIAACVTIFPIMWLFFKQNVAFSTGAGGHSFGLFVPLEAFDLPRVLTLLIFYLFEFGLYWLLIYPKYKRDPLFWGLLVVLVLVPNFKVGSIRDFCMNASLPALFILMIYTYRYVIDEYREEFRFKAACRYVGLIFALVISTTTLVGDCVNKCRTMNDWGVFPYVADDWVTLSDKQIGDMSYLENYLVPNPENTAFFKYIAR